VVRVTGDRDALVQYLERQDIQTNVYYPLPLYRQRAFGGEYKNLCLPYVEQLCREVIALPMYPELDPRVLTQVISAINSF
jgi:dTDP-4-amino-4,6-dideoxygalactose transaminase